MCTDARAAVQVVVAGLAQLPQIERHCALAELDVVVREHGQESLEDDSTVDRWVTRYFGVATATRPSTTAGHPTHDV